VSLLAAQLDTLHRLQPQEVRGAVASVRGLSIVVEALPLPVGSLVRLVREGHDRDVPLWGEVIGFDGARSIVMLLGSGSGVSPGMTVVGEQTAQTVQVGCSLLGRIINGLGQPLDHKPRAADTVARPLHATPTAALHRRRIEEPLPTGVRALDALVTIGRGQRVGVFSGPGVGKSTLLSVIARNTAADVNVIALVGERGREVREFVETTLGEEGLARSVLVVATSDESPLMRVRAAMVACAVAEFFRELGQDVMLMMDSITRFAQAQRQIGLTVGEQPATKGYTPSVFALLPVLLERAGAIEGGGSITGLYSILVEGDDMTEPISDAARGILDGHVTLSRRLATQGRFPAIDVLDSISRVADDVCDEPHRVARRELLALLSTYAEAEELINIGAYAKGSNPLCDVAIEMRPVLDEFLRQEVSEASEYPVTCRRLIELARMARQLLDKTRAT
jgi:flagellum-specific ATP synthase